MPVNLPLDTDLGEFLLSGEEDLARAIADTIGGHVAERYAPGKEPARRDAHPKAHGCVRAEFRVESDLPALLAQGVFVPGAVYAAWIRFSNGSGKPYRSDAKGDARGMAIKLLGVPGEKILPDERSALTHDFVMIDHPVFIVDDPGRYLRFVRWSNSHNPVLRWLAPLGLGLRGMLVGRAITRKTIANPLTTRYWSTTAYRLGTDGDKTAIKFSAVPHEASSPSVSHRGRPHLLREAMIAHLAEREARFDFSVQPRTSPAMSVERSNVEWDESKAPFFKVATITIPSQKFASPAQDAFGDDLSFTPWHALPAHKPLGIVNRVRRVVYESVSKLRHDLNGSVRREPAGDESFD